jgi:hypothetical protein
MASFTLFFFVARLYSGGFGSFRDDKSLGGEASSAAVK